MSIRKRPARSPILRHCRFLPQVPSFCPSCRKSAPGPPASPGSRVSRFAPINAKTTRPWQRGGQARPRPQRPWTPKAPRWVILL